MVSFGRSSAVEGLLWSGWFLSQCVLRLLHAWKR